MRWKTTSPSPFPNHSENIIPFRSRHCCTMPSTRPPFALLPWVRNLRISSPPLNKLSPFSCLPSSGPPSSRLFFLQVSNRTESRTLFSTIVVQSGWCDTLNPQFQASLATATTTGCQRCYGLVLPPPSPPPSPPSSSSFRSSPPTARPSSPPQGGAGRGQSPTSGPGSTLRWSRRLRGYSS